MKILIIVILFFILACQWPSTHPQEKPISIQPAQPIIEEKSNPVVIELPKKPVQEEIPISPFTELKNLSSEPSPTIQTSPENLTHLPISSDSTTKILAVSIKKPIEIKPQPPSFPPHVESGQIYLIAPQTFEYLLQSLSKHFQSSYPNIQLEIHYDEPTHCLEKIEDIESKYHLAFSTQRSQNAKSISIAQDSLMVIVHHQNPITNINKENLAYVYSGEKTNWNALCSISGNIIVCGRKNDSIECRIIQEKILQAEMSFLADMLEFSNEEELLQKVSEDVYSIGIISKVYFQRTKQYSSIQPIELIPNVLQYPIYLIVKPNTENSAVEKFIQFVTSKTCQQNLQLLGYSPPFKER